MHTQSQSYLFKEALAHHLIVCVWVWVCICVECERIVSLQYSAQLHTLHTHYAQPLRCKICNTGFRSTKIIHTQLCYEITAGLAGGETSKLCGCLIAMRVANMCNNTQWCVGGMTLTTYSNDFIRTQTVTKATTSKVIRSIQLHYADYIVAKLPHPTPLYHERDLLCTLYSGAVS